MSEGPWAARSPGSTELGCPGHRWLLPSGNRPLVPISRGLHLCLPAVSSCYCLAHHVLSLPAATVRARPARCLSPGPGAQPGPAALVTAPLAARLAQCSDLLISEEDRGPCPRRSCCPGGHLHALSPCFTSSPALAEDRSAGEKPAWATLRAWGSGGSYLGSSTKEKLGQDNTAQGGLHWC